MKPTHSLPAEPVCPDRLGKTQQYLTQLETGKTPAPEQETAWKEFFREQTRKIRSFAYSLHVPKDRIDDCVQDVWGELLVRLREFELNEEKGQFDTWLYAIVRSKVVNNWRFDRRDTNGDPSRLLAEIEDRSLPHVETAANKELLAESLRQLRGELTDCNYQVLKFRLVEDQTVEEVAVRLDLSHEQVWYRYHRARHRLEQIATRLSQQGKLQTMDEEKKKSNKNAQGNSPSAVSRSAGQSSLAIQGGGSMDLVFKRLELGRQNSIAEWKVEWNTENGVTPKLYIRKLAMVAYAEICGPEELINNHWAQITNAAVAAGVAAGIASIIAAPTGAVKVFRAEFEKQLGGKVGKEVPENIHVALCARQEANGPWCACEG